MLDLNNPKWKTFKGGLGTLYDASEPLKRLEKADTSYQIESILKEFWTELIHQRGIGRASYMALPHLIRIAKEKKLENWDIPALVASIEIERQRYEPIPEEYQKEYENEIKEIIEVIKINQFRKWDRTYAVCACAAIAVANGDTELSEIILELDDKDLANKFEMFLDKYDEFVAWLDIE